MRNIILGVVGLLCLVWGGLVLLRMFLRGGLQGAGAVYLGHFTAMVFSIALFVGGAYYLIMAIVAIIKRRPRGDDD